MQLSVQANLIHLDYPREVNLFRRIVHDKEQFNRWWVSLDNASDAHMTVYGFRETKAPNHRRGDYQTAIVRHFVGLTLTAHPLSVASGLMCHWKSPSVKSNGCMSIWLSRTYVMACGSAVVDSMCGLNWQRCIPHGQVWSHPSSKVRVVGWFVNGRSI